MVGATKRERLGSERSTKSERLPGKPKGKQPTLKEQGSKDKLKPSKKGSKESGHGKGGRGEKGRRSKRKEEKVIDDTQSEISYGQPDMDLSKSKASKRAFGEFGYWQQLKFMAVLFISFPFLILQSALLSRLCSIP